MQDVLNYGKAAVRAAEVSTNPHEGFTFPETAEKAIAPLSSAAVTTYDRSLCRQQKNRRARKSSTTKTENRRWKCNPLGYE
jgi:hypothetical protein